MLTCFPFCQVTGSPEPSVEWIKDGETVTTARDDPRSHRWGIIMFSDILCVVTSRQRDKYESVIEDLLPEIPRSHGSTKVNSHPAVLPQCYQI